MRCQWIRAAGILTIALSSRQICAGPYTNVLIEGVPHVRQKPDFCGEACAEMFLRKLGRDLDQDAVFDFSGLSPLLARGCYTPDLKKALEGIGFKVGRVWHSVELAKLADEVEQQWKSLHADLLQGVPSIVCSRYSDAANTTEHFRLILGYEAKGDEVLYHEPAEDNGAYRRMKREQFLKLWPLKYEEKKWTVIRLRLEPTPTPAPYASEGFTAADYAQHIMDLKKKVPEKGFAIVLQPPFVVIGDEPEATVKLRSEKTVQRAVTRLKKAYFKKDPREILDVWLFKDKDSYEKNVREIFKDEPSTPFGYYSHTHKALIMNIGTGGGTLVHEIVHPFIESNFPQCPAWFNEGLGSLYEQSSEKNGQIHGLTNWRLAGLQRAIKAGKVPSFKDLTSTSDHKFYSEDRGTNYAQARYLCYYLQEQGLLRKFYREFVANADKDASGYETLKKVLGEEDMDAFKKKWEEFVLGLTFP